MTIEIQNFYLNTNMPIYKYMKVAIELIPQEVIHQYNLMDLVVDGIIYLEIHKAMYGMPQTDKIANNKLVQHLSKFGYAPTKHTPGLWHCTKCNTQFTLVVDNFGIHYESLNNIHHLIQALEEISFINIDWLGSSYIGLQLKWDYINRSVKLSMPGYINNVLHKHQHASTVQSQHAPAPTVPIIFGAPSQEPNLHDISEKLEPHWITRIQQIVGSLLFYAQAVVPTLFVDLNDIVAQQSQATFNTKAAITQLLDYCATYPSAALK